MIPRPGRLPRRRSTRRRPPRARASWSPSHRARRPAHGYGYIRMGLAGGRHPAVYSNRAFVVIPRRRRPRRCWARRLVGDSGMSPSPPSATWRLSTSSRRRARAAVRESVVVRTKDLEFTGWKGKLAKARDSFDRLTRDGKTADAASCRRSRLERSRLVERRQRHRPARRRGNALIGSAVVAQPTGSYVNAGADGRRAGR